MKTPEEQLLQAWNENCCGDPKCMSHRLAAALKVIAGEIPHNSEASKIMPQPTEGNPS